MIPSLFFEPLTYFPWTFQCSSSPLLRFRWLPSIFSSSILSPYFYFFLSSSRFRFPPFCLDCTSGFCSTDRSPAQSWFCLSIPSCWESFSVCAPLLRPERLLNALTSSFCTHQCPFPPYSSYSVSSFLRSAFWFIFHSSSAWPEFSSELFGSVLLVASARSELPSWSV